MKLLRFPFLACALTPLSAVAQEAPVLSGNWQMLREAASAPRGSRAPDAQGVRIKAEPGLTLSFWGAGLIGVQPRKQRTPRAAFAPGADGMPDQELRRCREETARIDRGSGKAKVTDGTSLVPPAQIIKSDDYPWRALQNGWTGRTTLQLTVSAAGLVSGCRTAVSSGHALLDQKACILYSRRARFSPALDADGNATEAVCRAPVLWMLG